MGKPDLERISADAPIEEILEILDRDGGLIIKGLVDSETLQQIAKELKPFEQPDQEWKGNFFPEATKRICGAVGKSKTLATKVFMHPLYQDVCNKRLTITKQSRYGDDIRTFKCSPVGNASTTFDIGPGATAQQLHRDDGVHHLTHPNPQPYMIGMLLAETRTTPENGATVVIPGSHKWGDWEDRPPMPEETIPATLEPGDALLFDGAVFHGGGTNSTESERRKVHGVFMIRGNLRPEENTYLSLPPSIAESYPDDVLKAYGYGAASSGLGWVDYKEPLAAVLGREVKQPSLQFGAVGYA
ncbi:PhyH-domain-containing protein [Lophium mytilinum]|uniref:PhyH-domain-containing protein n=1 Tax=Lophium mytilinum TaxID=390894 RepID=A0A6A6RAQ9_9PEZI|nr:PhyH-domain-containing protein [Lophium mytilinum]